MDGRRCVDLARGTFGSISRRTILGAAAASLVFGGVQTDRHTANAQGSAPTGELAYSVKNGGFWDIWTYSFDTGQNTQLTSEPYSDQWAPAWSHNGLQLAYLSDQTDGSTQIWMMDPYGLNQRQITSWYGDASIVGVTWSPDDSRLLVTLLGDRRQIVSMPSGGGEFSAFTGPSSSFPSVSANGNLVFASDTGNPTETSVYFGTYANPGQSVLFAMGDAPVVSPDGAYVVVQIGAPGGRSISTYPLSSIWSALPPAVRVGDDSNPVWLTATHDYLAFVSGGVNGESIHVWRVGDSVTTPLIIAPHDGVWYLSKRFGGQVVGS